MIFINPKTDFAFKKIFGSDQSKDILISFLNALLYEARPVIKDLQILNPYLAPRIRGVKDTYLDVKAKLKDGTTVIIEMQVLNVEGFEKRILYNAAKAYSIQLDSGEDYKLLEPVIALTITDFEMFDSLESAISRFVLKEKEFLVDYLSYDIELVFVELPKFNKRLEELETLTDKWIYFIKNARSLDSVPETMEEVPEMKQAFAVANQANLSREELEDLQKREMWIHDQRNAITKAVNQAVKQKQVEIARRLLDVLDEETVSQTTGLSLEVVQQLRRDR
ncbi:Rpn family recombination-promoting nuclease/putative transposase [Coleofasciculus sp. E1-EBD-02]|uniref:Rpn family recombination-promoting nuclease/putative transposase n=1 Tax=Coleofasciculus sp. E1-EBD-02 TaxID=3068481 RepID=UPI0032FE2792